MARTHDTLSRATEPGCSTESQQRWEAYCRVKSDWQAGELIDAGQVLSDSPDLGRDRSIVLELACEEYLRKVEAGLRVDLSLFCRQFPGCETSLYRALMAYHCLEAEPVADEPDWPEPGDEFVGHQIEAVLGQGGLARVLLARKPDVGNRLVALKVAQQAAAEANTLGRLAHPNIMPVLDVYHDLQRGLSAVAMPYLGRATLADLLKVAGSRERRRLGASVILKAAAEDDPAFRPAMAQAAPHPRLRRGSFVDGVLHLGVHLAEALAFAHAQGVYHLDLKPSNVLLTAEGVPLLLDFNLSFDEQADGGKQGGTLPYMSPEQIRAIVLRRPGPQGLDHRSDLYSLGVVLYQLLAGELPTGPLPQTLATRQMAEELLERQAAGAALLGESLGVNPELARIVARSLAADPAERFPTAAALAAALRGQLSLANRARRWTIGRRRAGAAVLVAAVLLMGGWSLHLAGRPPYTARQLAAAEQSYQAGDYRGAVRLSSTVLELEPESWEALFLRGRAYQRSGEYLLALRDYEAASKLREDPRVAACRGYCFSKTAYDRLAVQFYLEAIHGGFENAELWNNLGYSQAQLAQFVSARNSLGRAIEQDPSLGVAYHNRALVNLREAARAAAVNRDLADECLVEGLADVQSAIELSPASGELYSLAARFHVMALSKDAQAVDQALACLEKAVQHGADPAWFRVDYAHTPLALDVRFTALCNRPANHSQAYKASLIIDPLLAARTNSKE